MPEMTVRSSTRGFPGLPRGRWASSVFHVSSDSQNKLPAMTSASSDSNHDKKYTMEPTLCMGSQPSVLTHSFSAAYSPYLLEKFVFSYTPFRVRSLGPLTDACAHLRARRIG